MSAAARITGPRLLLWAGIAVALIDLLFFTGASNFGTAVQARVLNQVLFLGAAVGLGIAAWRGTADLRSPFLPAIGAWIAAVVIATLASRRPEVSREALATLLLAAPGYLSVRAALWTPWLRRRIDGLLVAATLVFVVAYLLQAGTQWLAFWSVAGLRVPPLRPGDVGLTVGTVNAVALYLELLVPLAAWLSWSVFGRRRVALALVVLGVVALVVTGSRGAWLGACAATVLVGAAAWWRAGRPVPVPSGRGARALGVAIPVAGIGLTLVLLPSLMPRLLAGDAGRAELWSAAWQLFQGAPLTGTGPGTFPQLRAETPISEPNLAVLATSHSSVLQVLTDGGLVLLAAALVVIAVTVRLVLRDLSARRAPGEPRPGYPIAAALLAMAVHSMVDTQVHIVAVVLLLFLLAARLDPPAVPAPPRPPDRLRLALGGAAVLAGVALAVPIDLAGLHAQVGLAALDRGDARAALQAYRSAVSLHELASYRLGEGVAASRLGDAAGAATALERAAMISPLTFLVVSAAATVPPPEREAWLERETAAGPYDASASLNAAWLRFPTAPEAGTEDLTDAMVLVSSLILSTRPDGVFDAATWEAARRAAFVRIAERDPVAGCAIATRAGWTDEAATLRARVADPAVGAALDLLAQAVATGTTDVERVRSLLRADPTNAAVVGVLWQAGFAARSQPTLDAVRAVSIPVFFNLPASPMEVVVDGRVDADWSWRLPRWPMASDGRLGPKRPYAAGMLTIEPVFRPD